MTDNPVIEKTLEEMAQQFLEDTGLCAPFKMATDEEYRDAGRRNDIWSAWCKGRMRGLEILG